jgi:hypothetical protein
MLRRILAIVVGMGVAIISRVKLHVSNVFSLKVVAVNQSTGTSTKGIGLQLPGHNFLLLSILGTT